MKTLSKRMLSIVLALVMAMPVMLALPFSAQASLADADNAIADYLNKMDGNTAYRNMLPAYKAYVDLCEAVDAVRYGGSSTAQLTAATTALTTAMNSTNMPTWSAATGTTDADNTGYSSAIYAPNLYYPSSSENTGSAYFEFERKSNGWLGIGNGANGSNTYVYQPSPILIYNGSNTMTFPVSFWLNPTKDGSWGYNQRCDYIYTNTTAFSINQNWVGDNFKIGKQYSGSTTYSAIRSTSNEKVGYASDHTNQNKKTDLEIQIANRIIVDGSKLSYNNWLSTTNTTSWILNMGNENGKALRYITSSAPLYVIDYRNIASTVATYKAYLSTVSNFNEGGLVDFFTRFDQLTIDVDNYDYSSNVASKAAEVATILKNGYDNIEGAYNARVQDDSTKYIKLRNAMDYSGTPTAADETNAIHNMTLSVRDLIENNGHITVSGHDVLLDNYAAFEAAYNAAANIMKSLETNNTDGTSQYGGRRGETTAAANALLVAFNNLDKTINVTFNKNGGTSTPYTLELGCNLTSIPGNTEDTHIADTNTHNVFSWHGSPNTSTPYYADTTYTEDFVSEPCTLTRTVTNEAKTIACSANCGNSTVLSLTAYRAAETTAQSKASKDYTTSSFGNLTSALSDANSALCDDATDTDGEITALTSSITTAIGNLVQRASFTALDTAYTTANTDFAAVDSTLYTTTSYNAVSTFLSNNANFPYHFKTTEQRADIAADTYQTAINNEKDSLTNALSRLERRASFTALDNAKKVWTDYLADHSSEYTTSSKTALSNYINSSAEGDFPLENSADRADTGESQNDAIAAEVTKYGNIKASDYLDPVADISSLEDAYAEGDELLDSLVGKAAQYDSTSVSALITAVEAANDSKFIGATAEEKADFGTKGESSDQDAADALAKDINDAIEGLKLAEIIDATTGNAVDTSAFEAAVNTINNLDPDAYEEDELHSLANAKDTINDYYGTAKVEYGDDYINVVNGITTQAKAEEATCVILGALNSCIKRYAVTRNGFSNYGIKNGTEKNGEINYGATLTCDSGSAETAWFIEIETSSMHKYLAFQKYGRELETKILGRTVVNAVKRDATNNCRIMITRSYGDDRAPVQYANFVANGTEFELPSAPSVAYYHFEGYKYKNGANINTSTITINGDTEIVAVYSQNNTLSCSVNAKDINEKTIPTDSVAYNEKVVLDGGEGTYGWLEKIGTTYRPFYIGRKVSFFATESIVLEAVDEETFNSYGSIPCVNLRQSGVVTADSKKVFDAQLVPGDADVREYGILIAAPSSKGGSEARTPLDSEIIIENSGQQAGYAILRAKSTKLVGANQFSIVVSGALPEGYKYRGYVIYQYKGSLKTVYSDIMQ